MRILAVVFHLMLAPVLAIDARAGTCAPAAFGSVKVGVDRDASPMTPPKQFVLPERWIAVDSAGFFINEGQDDWLILDVDTRSLQHVAFVAMEKYRPGRYTGYTAILHAPRWMELRRTTNVPREAFDSILCKANYIWAYESPSAASLRRLSAEEETNGRELKAWKRKSMVWEKAFKRCRNTRGCHPEPPPASPPLMELTVLALDGGSELFHEATDVGQVLILNDQSVRKTVGGAGVLAGEAEAIRNQLFGLMKPLAE